MDAWLGTVDIGDDFVTCNENTDCPGYIQIAPSDDGKKLFLVRLEDYSVVTEPTDPLNNYTLYQTYIGYNSEAIVYEEQEIPAGWNILKVNTITALGEVTYEYDAIPITVKSEFYFKYYGYLNGYSETITSVDFGFSRINGKVIGIIQGEPAQYFDYTVTVNNGTYELWTIGAKDDKIEKYGTIEVDITPNEGYTGPAVNSAIVTGCTVFDEYPPLGPTIQSIQVSQFTGNATIILNCIEELNP